MIPILFNFTLQSRFVWHRASVLLAMLLVLVTPAWGKSPQSILFVGNSFIYGYGSPVLRYRSDTVHDLNGDRFGGVPALFKRFTKEAGLDYEVSLETVGGYTLKNHYLHKANLIDHSWDHVILQEQSELDPDHPGDPTNLRIYAGKLTTLFKRRNPHVDIRMFATWSSPYMIHAKDGHWHGQPIEAMGQDLDAAYMKVAEGNPDIDGVIPVGLAFNRAIAMHVADSNPYDGISAGRVDLWTYDNHHASAYGYYLEALMDFGAITGKDPRTLGEDEKAALDLGLSPEQAKALQDVAYRQLQARGGASNSRHP
jgi:hypothetical protein